MRNKKFFSLLLLIGGYFILLVGQSCVQEQLPDLYSRCPGAREANATDIQVKYLPYKNDRFSTDADTVPLNEFELVVELDLELLSDNSSAFSPLGAAYALTCLPLYNFTNISNIAVTLTKPLGNLQAGSDISYLFENRDQIPLSEIRDFSKFENLFSLKFSGQLENNSQIHTRTYLFLKDGRQLIFESSSPVLTTN
ncbi:MAG: hypothetical protein HWE15_07075 [Algoriphagus sp.]|uniref:hypothetical protein n=1 Tax=Algoriphagus sp. TaxID=1872435 RepID=UPI0017F906CA|nr:hypothetical protein [Algoriphagus sp.]NVJ86050.1 hypothetical protein [Algoriphagus sp.]